ncbi:cytochrome P450 71A9-like [Telopea speciosissima]|uniref:cytochrome P450 71A9-like n=1 Tax=Telopea speciosissima TaxID=54955 RepID=UPI001CC684CE|nr:cytochrome P450 71A9-like [Telopea speciosissima]
MRNRRNDEGRKIKNRKLPPGPKRLPIIGNLHQLGNLPHRSLQRLSQDYGPLMFLQLGSIPTLVISSADVAREIFKGYDLVFSGRPLTFTAKRLSDNCSDITFAPYGDYWREIRKITILELLNIKRVLSFRAVREEEVDLMVASISSSSSSIPINLSEMTLCFTNNVICRVAFGRKYEGGGSNREALFYRILKETQELLGSFSISDFFPWMEWINKVNGLQGRVEKTFHKLDNFYNKVIDEHLDPSKSKPQQEDLVNVLLRVQKDSTQGMSLTRDQIKGVLTDMFIAGTDTTAATVIWTMAELIRHPNTMKRTQEEVRRVIGRKQKVEENDLPRLNYLKLVVKEALRLHPPTPLLVPRETMEDCTIKGYDIQAKTRVFINARSIATDKKYWDNPEEFQPERFLHNSINFKGLDFELLPFGAGRRGCPGIDFSVVLIELVLANILHCFDWKLPSGVEVADLDMTEAVGLTMHKKSHLLLVATTANIGINE